MNTHEHLNSSADRPRAALAKSTIAGWVLSGLLTAFMLFSSMGKFSDFEGKAEMFAHLGWSESVMVNIGVVEIAIALLFLVPRTAFIAAILLTAYLGGAIATHVRVNDAFIFPLIICVIYWVALGLRDRRVFALGIRHIKVAPSTQRVPRLKGSGRRQDIRMSRISKEKPKFLANAPR